MVRHDLCHRVKSVEVTLLQPYCLRPIRNMYVESLLRMRRAATPRIYGPTLHQSKANIGAEDIVRQKCRKNVAKRGNSPIRRVNIIHNSSHQSTDQYLLRSLYLYELFLVFAQYNIYKTLCVANFATFYIVVRSHFR